MTRLKNFSRDGPTPSIIDVEYEMCNFARPQPVGKGGGVFEGVRLFPGDDTPRTFVRCNLINCEVPPGSVVTNCNTAIIERDLIKKVDTIVVDGESFDMTTKINRVHGRWTPEGYEYKSSPEEIEN